MSDNPAKFEEAWKTWERQVDVCEKLATFRLDDDVKISVVLREAPPKLRDKLLVSSQQFESNCNKREQSSMRAWTRTKVGLRITSEMTRNQTQWKLTT